MRDRITDGRDQDSHIALLEAEVRALRAEREAVVTQKHCPTCRCHDPQGVNRAKPPAPLHLASD